jgi:orotate phosphoribosyltransferase
VEGCFAEGSDVVIVEDVITTGGSALEAIRVVEAAGARVLGVLTVVDREAGGRAALEHAGYAVEALLTARDLGFEADG